MALHFAQGRLSPLGLAASVAEFLDFGSSLLSDTKEIYRSASGLTSANDDLQTVAATLSRLCASLEDRQLDTNARNPTWKEMAGIAAAAQEAAVEILSYLSCVKAPRPGAHSPRHGRWASFRQALVGIYTKDVVVKLEARMSSLRSQLNTSLIAHISYQQELALRFLQGMIDGVLDEKSKSLGDEIRASLSLSSSDKLDSAAIKSLDGAISDLWDKSEMLRREKEVLSSLKFDQMHDRESGIVDAHAETFKWIFEQNRWPDTDPRAAIRFREWLAEEDGGVYWVAGKPGSGKSTLMKYIARSCRTQQHLKVWAAGSRLGTPSFFFWISGSDMQKSQQGLLRQLLYEILSTFPDLIQHLFRTTHSSDYWSTPRLFDGFQRLGGVTAAGAHTTKLCFFIDGLDEYGGDPRDLIQTIRTMSRLEGVKLCVSSRPWNCFENAFGKNPRLKLYLHHLTKDDITRYARVGLSENRPPSDAMFEYSHSTYNSLIEEIVERAEGVFLWVFLVVRSLREGLDNGDSMDLLRERLQQMPVDLNEFFKRILTSVDKVYWKRMSAFIQFALISTTPIQLIQYKFLDEEDPSHPPGNHHFSPPKQGSLPRNDLIHDIDEEEAKINKQLNGRYKGLFEAKDFPRRKTVVFLHRTVRDFLLAPDMQGFLGEQLGPRFDPYLHGCRALRSQARALPGSLLYSNYYYTLIIDGFMSWARNVEARKGYVDVEIMEEMRLHYRAYRPEADCGITAISFEGRAILFGIESYVRYLCRHHLDLKRDGFACLELALFPFTDSDHPPEEAPDGSPSSERVLRLLLGHGASPNHRRGNSSVLESYLDIGYPSVGNSPLPAFPRSFRQALPLLVDHGAQISEAFQGPDCWFNKVLWHRGEWRLFPSKTFFSSTSTIRMYLETFFVRGLDANEPLLHRYAKWEGQTLWHVLLASTIGAQVNHCKEEALFVMLMKVFLANGANPHAQVLCKVEPDEQESRAIARDIGCAFEILPWMRRILGEYGIVIAAEEVLNCFEERSRVELDAAFGSARRKWGRRERGDRRRNERGRGRGSNRGYQEPDNRQGYKGGGSRQRHHPYERRGERRR